MQIKQLQMAYAPEQDRILMRLNFQGAQEIRCWLTRRMVGLLLPNLDRVMGQTIRSDRPLEPHSRQAILDMNRESLLYDADLTTPFEENSLDTPLGEEPLLISQIHLNTIETRTTPNLGLKLSTTQGKGFELKMDETLQHGFIELLLKTLGQAKWELSHRNAESATNRPPNQALN